MRLKNCRFSQYAKNLFRVLQDRVLRKKFELRKWEKWEPVNETIKKVLLFRSAAPQRRNRKPLIAAKTLKLVEQEVPS
jgi:hypothetical protein